jgi:hypothetical protein
MQDTQFKQLTLPTLALGTTDRVSVVATAGKRAMRVLINNLSAATCFFGTASESMIGPGAPGTDVFEVGPDTEAPPFVLAPGQKLFGCANAIGATISISTSDALDVQAAAL